MIAAAAAARQEIELAKGESVERLHQLLTRLLGIVCDGSSSPKGREKKGRKSWREYILR